jgi:oligopeptide transport system substrate-binding protein
MIFKRYRDYHDRFRGNIDQVHFTIALDKIVLNMYEQDQLDIIYPYFNASFQEARRLIQRHPDEYFSMPDPNTYSLAFDTTRPPFDDPKVRLPMVLAIDRETLANRHTQGLDFPARGGMVPPGVAGHLPGIALPYNPELAREKLSQAGYPGGEGFPPVEGSCFAYSGNREIGEYLIAQWKSVLGIDVSFDFLESFVSDDYYVRRPPNLWLRGWSADYLDPDSFLRYSQWRIQSGWHNDHYQALVEGARRTSDQLERLAMYRQAEQILLEETPVVPINYGRLHILIKPWLPGLPASMITGNILKDVIIEPH